MSDQQPGTPPPSPKASRTRRPRWLDPKLIFGVLFVLISTGVGARIISEADATIEVWAVKSDTQLAESNTVQQDQLTPVRVRFQNPDDANRYVSADDDLPSQARMTRSVGGGELLPRNAFTNDRNANLRDIALPVEQDYLPSGLQANDRIDVYVVPDSEGEQGSAESAEKILTNATVVATPDDSGGLSGGTAGQVTVRVAVEEDKVAEVAGQLASGTSYAARYSGR